MHIPAGNPDARQRFSVAVPDIFSQLSLPCSSAGPCELAIFGNFPHMHLFGKSVTTSVASGPILLDIPAWNVHWQSDYQFQSPVVAGQNDSIVVECHYDNSAHNQPILGGQKQVPRDISWGPGALDEMCLSYLFVVPRSQHQ